MWSEMQAKQIVYYFRCDYLLLNNYWLTKFAVIVSGLKKGKGLAHVRCAQTFCNKAKKTNPNLNPNPSPNPKPNLNPNPNL